MEERKMSERAARIMQNPRYEQRAAVRKAVCLSATVSCAAPQCQDKIGLIRDVSASGIFFYSNLSPEMGSTVTLSFTIPPSDHSAQDDPTGEITCTGKVIRVVQFSEGAATGIAIRLEERELKYHRVS